ncbi:hypothetical protein D3C79_1009200 [compost metagenome]
MIAEPEFVAGVIYIQRKIKRIFSVIIGGARPECGEFADRIGSEIQALKKWVGTLYDPPQCLYKGAGVIGDFGLRAVMSIIIEVGPLNLFIASFNLDEISLCIEG